MATAPPASTPGPAPSSGRDNVVGIALIVGAVLIGLFLLVKGYDSEGGVVAADKASTETTTATTAPVESTTTTTVATKPPADVDRQGGQRLGQVRGCVLDADHVAGEGLHPGLRRRCAQHRDRAPRSCTWTVPRGTAQAVAAALGVDAAAVAPVPTPRSGRSGRRHRPGARRP